MKKTKPIKKQNRTLKLLFSSLFKNDAAVEGGRTQPWWIALTLLLVSVIIAIIPTMIQIGQTKGSDVFKGAQYQTDVALVKFNEALVAEGVDLVYREDINTGYLLRNEGTAFETAFSDKISISSVSGSVDVHYFSFAQPRNVDTTNSEGEQVEQSINFEYLRVYYTGNITEQFALRGESAEPEVYLANYLITLSENSTSVDPNAKVTSHVILGKSGLYFRVYNPTKVLLGSDYVRSTQGVSLDVKESFALHTFNQTTLDGQNIVGTDPQYVSKVMANWSHLVDITYGPVKTITFWTTNGINGLIYLILSIFIGLIFFITTRGKYNPNRDIKFFEAMKIGAWLLLTPALLTLIVGSFVPSYASLVYIMTLGMRTVWMSMKSVQPPAK